MLTELSTLHRRFSALARSCNRRVPFVAAGVLLAWAVAPGSARAQGCANRIACENQQTGDTNWAISGSGDTTIQGFATDISYKPGDTVNFKIKTDANNYTIAIYRMGYYGGAGARRITTISPSVSLPQTQPACLTDANTNLLDCGNWNISASWQVPSAAVSGLYFALLTRTDTGGQSQIFFVVRDDSGHSDILYVTSDETWQAYNDYGGHSLYGTAGAFDLNNRAYKVSYNRPFDTRSFEAATFLFNAEYPMIRFLEANGYDVSYFTNIDQVRNGSLMTNHKIVISSGHDEYVSGPRRTNIEAARDAGVNLAFFSGNEVFWKTRWENSIDGSNTPYRTLVCYKETYYGTGQAVYQRDPNDPSTWTGTWRDPRFSPPADGGRPENALTGTIFLVNGPGPDNTDLSIQVPAADGKMRFWRNTSIAAQSPGQVATLPAGTLGYEWDGDMDNGARPAGLFQLSSATYSLTADLLLDYGATYGAGTLTHHATLYRAPSGALVFGAGTVQWAWGLDNNHDGGGGSTSDVRMQQATINLFADMGVQPTTLQSGLVNATQSTDHTPPTVAITSPASGGTVSYGSPITITGTAADSGGGVVGAVEVSTDGGQTWHPATGRESWSYQWYPYAQSGPATVMARAVDDSGNLQTNAASVSFNVSGEPACPCTLWNSSATPTNASEPDSAPVELGVKFMSDVAGSVTGIRFYKGPNNTGTHVGHLWTQQGSLLATVTFTNETATGWQQANFSSPVPISAKTVYVVSYYAPNGGYADDEPYFGTQLDRPPLHAPATNAVGGNGVYVYAVGGGFPTATYQAGNYWVDVVFAPPSPWSISGNITGASGVTVSLSGSGTSSTTTDSSGNYTFSNIANGTYTVTPSKSGYSFTPASQSVTVNGASVSGINFTASALPTYSITGNAGIAAATVTLSGTQNQTVTADASGNYSFGSVVNGNYVVTPGKAQYAFTPSSRNVTVNGANLTGVNFSASAANSIWNDSTVPGTPDVTNDPSPVELGLKFRSDVAGTITGVRFYKGVGNSGVHIGNLWSSSGTNLASVTFTGETASGWQQASFASPVAIAANTTYIVSYYAPNGNYAADVNFFANAGVDHAPLHALQNGVDGANGVYVYGTGGGFPFNTYNATNYWVDVVFVPSSGGSFSISGTVTNGSAATVSLTGAASGSTTADGSGNYSFGGLANGSYTVTPTKIGFSVSPASQNVTLSGSNVSGVNFTATANTYSLSGTITNGSGATVTLTGAASGSTTADPSGNYSFSNLANGSYTVTPAKSGFTITPPSQNVTVNNANVTGVNFSADAATGSFSISGTIINGSGATVTLSGAASGATTADGSGTYSFSNLANGSYTITPSKSGFSFTPANQSVTVSGASVAGIDFTAKGIIRDVTVSKDQSTASKTVASPVFSTSSPNELLLAFISADRLSLLSNTTVSSISGGGLTWTLVKRTNGQNGTAEIWRALATAPLTNVTVTATLNQTVQSSLTVMSFAGIDTSGTNGSGAIGATGGASAATGAPSASLVTTRINSWVFGVGNDYDNAIARSPATGQSLVHQYLATNTGDTYWVQMQNAPTPASGTTVKINDTAPTGDRYNLAICAVQPAP